MDPMQKALISSRQAAAALQSSLADRDNVVTDAKTVLDRQLALVKDLQTKVDEGAALMDKLTASLGDAGTQLGGLKDKVDAQTRALSDLIAS